MTRKKDDGYEFFSVDKEKLIKKLGKQKLIDVLKEMLLIRNFETRAEAAYQQGHVGGFFHSYVGQEAIQTAAVAVFGKNQWYIATYRCHAIALLLGVPPKEIMAELYGKVTGNAKGRGGSMHLYSERLLGGFGIVGGQIPVATGVAFRNKYLDSNEVSVCFLGDGAMPQGSFHESLNLASLWDLPCIYIIENNQWSMGTAIQRGVSNYKNFSQDFAHAYGINSYRFNGMDFFNCYGGFTEVLKEIQAKKRPIVIECVAERFKGHSISDPAFYRTKEALKECMQRDPLLFMKNELITHKMITEDEYKALDKEQRSIAIEAMKFAEESPWPDISTLEEGVFAP